MIVTLTAFQVVLNYVHKSNCAKTINKPTWNTQFLSKYNHFQGLKVTPRETKNNTGGFIKIISSNNFRTIHTNQKKSNFENLTDYVRQTGKSKFYVIEQNNAYFLLR